MKITKDIQQTTITRPKLEEHKVKEVVKIYEANKNYAEQKKGQKVDTYA